MKQTTGLKTRAACRHPNTQHMHTMKPHLLEQELRTLPLWSKAGDGPNFDLDAGVELLVPHVPHALDRCGYCFVLQIAEGKQAH